MIKFILIFILTMPVFASNWMPLSKIQSQSNQAFQLKADCEKSGEQCLDVGDEPQVVTLGFYSLSSVMGDDFENPIWEAESEVELCQGEEACQALLLSKTCPLDYSKFIDALYLKVYCTKVTGYAQKEIGKAFQKDNVAFDSYKSAQAQVQALNQGVSQALKVMDCGKKVQAHLLVRNSPKNLTKPQVKQLVLTFKDIKNLLDTGSLASAKEEIQAVAPDGVIVTAADKTALIGVIDECVGGN